MPWRSCCLMNERLKFVSRLLSGERMAELCREFGISRKTGYKFLRRYESDGEKGLYDRRRLPHRSPNRTPRDMVELIIEARHRRPTWGPKKLRWLLEREHPGVRLPAVSTFAVILKREGLVKGRRRRRRVTPSDKPLQEARRPNEVWAMDFKGQFRMGNGRYCYPLTVSDQHSRYLVLCEGLDSTSAAPSVQALKLAFRTYGLPQVIRSDNGSPFASTGRLGLTTLSVWLMRLGIELERIQPGQPQQNGRHERMHRTLKAETARPAQGNVLAQQECFDRFRKQYNEGRPHEALDMKTPKDVYEPSSKRYSEPLAPLTYPLHDLSCRVTQCGHIKVPVFSRSHYIGQALAGQHLGLRELDDGCWLVNFMHLELGYIDHISTVLLNQNR